MGFEGAPTNNQENNIEENGRDQRAEELLNFLQSADSMELFHGKKAEDIFLDERGKRDFIGSIQPAEFSELLDSINGVLRGKNKNEWGMDGDTVTLASPLLGIDHVPPRQEEKPELLEKVLQSAKEMNQEDGSLRDIAVMVCSSLNAIHPYIDANGRTSRLVYALLVEGFDRDRLRDILGEYGRDKIDINPALLQGEIDALIDDEIGLRDPKINTDNMTNLFWKEGGNIPNFEFNQQIADNDKNLFIELVKEDSDDMFRGVYQFMLNKITREKYLMKFPKRSAILVDALMKDSTSEDIGNMLKNYRELKKKQVSMLIDALAHPEKEEYQIEYEGRHISLKELFELRLKQAAENIAEQDRRYEERQNAEP